MEMNPVSRGMVAQCMAVVLSKSTHGSGSTHHFAIDTLCGHGYLLRCESLILPTPTISSLHSFRLNIWDVGGQKSLRSYWRNYFEQTDGLVWVVDSADRRRLEDTGAELARLLLEERLAGASLLVLANKQDIAGALAPSEIEQVAW